MRQAFIETDRQFMFPKEIKMVDVDIKVKHVIKDGSGYRLSGGSSSQNNITYYVIILLIS